MGGGRGASLDKEYVDKGVLLSEVRVATVHKCKSNVKGVWLEEEVHWLLKYV